MARERVVEAGIEEHPLFAIASGLRIMPNDESWICSSANRGTIWALAVGRNGSRVNMIAILQGKKWMGTDPAVSLERIGLLQLFRSLPVDALEDVRDAMRIERIARDATIFRQGNWVDRAYALGAGSVRIVQTGSDGGQAIVRFIGPGEMFGTLPLFTDHRFPADAIAVEASTVLTWPETDLLALMARYPGISYNVIGVLGARMAQLQERLRELTTQRVEQRVAHAIVRLAEQAGRDGTRGTTIEIPLRRKDLAEFAGTTLHTASRTVSAWEKAGLLVTDGQRLVIHDLAAIRTLAEGCRAMF